jgi:hypothetical protein
MVAKTEERAVERPVGNVEKATIRLQYSDSTFGFFL